MSSIKMEFLIISLIIKNEYYNNLEIVNFITVPLSKWRACNKVKCLMIVIRKDYYINYHVDFFFVCGQNQ